MITEFPDKCFETRITDSAGLACMSDDEDALLRVAGGVSYKTTRVAMISGIRHLALRGFKVMNPPRVAKSHGSNAVYLASGVNKSDGLLLQYLPPHSTTSVHYHAETSERFHLLAGNAVVSTPWGVEFDFASRRTITVDPFTVHQLRTREEDSLILLEMVFTSAGVGMSDHFYTDPNQSVDIHSKGLYPSSDLSNFGAHPFIFDGVECVSMEALLQSLKEQNPEVQKWICKLSGKEAKKYGEQLNSSRTAGDPLYWQGTAIDRFSRDYQSFLDRAYLELSHVPSFRSALLASGDKLLLHTMGKKTPEETILTEMELGTRLLRLRHFLRQQ
jgi:mannose-6-phosphate isomerase-like protein (cupin superfamily)